MNHFSSVSILNAATAVGAGERHTPFKTPKRAFQAYGRAGTGTGSATVAIRGSNFPSADPLDDSQWIVIGTITLNYVTPGAQVTDGFTTDAPWRHISAHVDSISAGIAAEISVLMGG